MKIKFIMFCTCLAVITACTQKLSREKAEELIKAFYHYPTVEISGLSYREFGSQSYDLAKTKQLVDLGVIYQSGYLPYTTLPVYDFTTTGKLFVTYSDPDGWTITHKVVTNCVAFDQITGLVMDEQNHSAKVEYTCKRVGVTPFGLYKDYSNGDTSKHTCTVTLYDNGWRIVDDSYKYTSPNKFSFFTPTGEYKTPPVIKNDVDVDAQGE